MRRRVVLLAVGAVLTLTGAVAAQDVPPIVELLGATAIEIPVRDVTQGPIAVDILARPGPAGPPQLLVEKVTLANRSEAVWTSAFSAEWTAIDANAGYVHVTVDPTKIPDAGAYTVTLLATPPPTRPANPQEPTKKPSQAIALTFTRPAAILQVASPIKIELTRWVNFFSTGTPSTATMVLSERSNRAAIADLHASPAGSFKQADGKDISAAIAISPTALPAAGGEGAASIEPKGYFPLGTSSGSFAFVSRQLEQPLTVSVEVMTRLSRLWIFITVIVGIYAGYRFRVRPEQELADEAAGIAAYTVLGRLSTLIATTTDDAIKRSLNDVVASLVSTMNTGEAAAIAQAAQTADQAITAILAKAETERGRIATHLAEVKNSVAGDTAGLAPAIATVVATSRQGLEDVAALLKQGRFGDADTRLNGIEPEIERNLDTALIEWTQGMRTIGALEPWGGRTLDQARDRIDKNVTDIENGADRAARLRLAVVTSRDIRSNLFGLGIKDVRTVAHAVTAAMSQEDAGAVERAVASLPDLSHADPDADAVQRLVSTVATLREAVVSGLQNSAAHTGADVESELAAGKMADAARKITAAASVAPKPKPRDPLSGVVIENLTHDLIEPLRFRHTIIRVDAAPELTGIPAPAPGHVLVLTVRPIITTAGIPTQVTLGSTPDLPEGTSVNWTVSGVATGTHGRTLSLTAQRSGPLLVRATALKGHEPLGTAEIELLVQPAPAETVAALMARKRATEKRRTLFAGVLIAFAGYFMFEVAFVGTLKDLFAIFIWGFTVDVGLAKVQELAAPPKPAEH